MIPRMPGTRASCGLFLAVLLSGGAFGQQQAADPLADVKDRYATAAYEGALTALDGMKPAESDTALRAEIEKYRALCFLALNRKAEAEQAIERFVTLDPFFLPDQLETSTWVRDAFRNVRRRTLPAIVTRRYEEAKTNVQDKSLQKAAAQLKEVVRLLDDPDLIAGTLAQGSWRADLKTVAQGFLDLAQAAPPPAPPPAPKPAEPPPPQALIPPQKISGDLPPWPANIRAGEGGREGRLELQIDESGNVTAVRVLVSLHPLYDRLLTDAVRTWKYKPATKGGVGVPITWPVRIVRPAPGGTVPQLR